MRGITKTEMQVVLVPCPPERRLALKAGINDLFAWLEELGEQQPAQPGQTIERICDEHSNN